jgi:hypothetical protein
MDALRFDRLARSFTNASSRRGLLRSLAASAIGLAAMRFSGGVEAKKKRKNKIKKPTKLKRNAFGCVDVGGKCRGNSANCCSGICEGEKPKQGKKDTSTCIAHNVGECQADQDVCLGNFAPCGTLGSCLRTTGKASFCGNISLCQACTRDTDCEAEFGPGAACGVCADACLSTGGTICSRAEPA